jgi:hypothetical protein
MGLRRGQMVKVWAMFLPHGAVPNRATVGRWVAQASRPAGGRLAGRAPLGQRWGVGRCVEEIVCQREPLLMAVEPQSMAWGAGPRGPDRAGERGSARVPTWPCVERVVADAGQGMERGVKLANEARADAAQEPTAARSIAMGLDVFHTWHCAPGDLHPRKHSTENRRGHARHCRTSRGDSADRARPYEACHAGIES